MQHGEQGTGAVNEQLVKLDTSLQSARKMIDQPADAAMIEQPSASTSLRRHDPGRYQS